MSKVTELLNNKEHISYSFELTPDIKECELENLEVEPLFFSITWHAQAHECKDLDIEPIKLAKYLRNKNKHVLMHITCKNLRKEYLNNLLVLLKKIGVCNLFIILGENFDPLKSDFPCSQDLIIYIRQRTGNYFCIGVAGFPDHEGDILHLKNKVCCGVDFILTQAFFECKLFKKFELNCVEAGITVPIIPGIFPFETDKELKSFSQLCKVHVTDVLIRDLSKKSGVEIISKLVDDIIPQLKIKHLHFFTLNKLKRTAILIKTTT